MLDSGGWGWIGVDEADRVPYRLRLGPGRSRRALEDRVGLWRPLERAMPALF